MRPPADYVVLRDLRGPGSDFAYAARAGDEITEDTRANAGWTVGADVRAMRPDSMPRPDDADDRRAWQDYAVVRGVPYSDAVALDRADLISRIDSLGDQPAEDAAPEVPEEKAAKSAWVDYAVAETTFFHPDADADAVRERAGAMTKADLVATFGPEADSPEATAARRRVAGLPEEVEVGPGGLVRPAGTGSPE